MGSRRPPDDSRLAAARYRIDKLVDEDRGADRPADVPRETQPAAPPREPTRSQLTRYVDVAVDQAVRRGDFDDVPGAGKPLENLDGVHDPNWWIRRKIEREKLTGLGPPALTLRTENIELEDRLDAVHHEREVRRILGEFNARVVEARRQLQGGPPVVTPTRDVDAEVAAWGARRDERRRLAEESLRREQERVAALTWRERRAERRRSQG